MDRRVIFVLVFIFTLCSTVLVGVVSVLTEQGMLNTVLYALATMWIVGIVAQVLLHNLYQGIVKPIEEEKREEKRQLATREINLEEVEAIEEVVDSLDPVEKRSVAVENKEEAKQTIGTGV